MLSCLNSVYSSSQHFHRVLHLISNEVMLKARDIVGEDIMEQPEVVSKQENFLNVVIFLLLCIQLIN